jgi:hypothetical protein
MKPMFYICGVIAQSMERKVGAIFPWFNKVNDNFK